jgi:hypothetical protein
VICHRCRRDFTGEHPCIERGVVLPDGTAVDADRNYCSGTCLSDDLTAPTKETSAP